MKCLLPQDVWSALRKGGPYVLVELLLPGGTLLALLLWLSSGMGRGLFADAHPPRISPSKVERVVAVPGQKGSRITD